LKKLLHAPTTDANLATFMRMVNAAPIRPGVGVRTPLSPADGLATIITNFVIRICNNYLPYTKQHKESEKELWLESTILKHLVLLTTPSYGRYSGGHLTRGLDGKLDALLGSTTPPDIAVNQTAITMLTLEEMRENTDPSYQARYGKLVQHLIALFTPEFKHELLFCYSPSRPAHRWLYNTAGKIEDQSHLKTTWSQLDALGSSNLWYRAQAKRIARAAPHVLAPWNDQSNVPGAVH